MFFKIHNILILVKVCKYNKQMGSITHINYPVTKKFYDFIGQQKYGIQCGGFLAKKIFFNNTK